jgi:ATP-binding cassette, subfamily B, bacterial
MSKQATNREIISYYLRHMRRYPLLMFGMFASAPLAILLNDFLPALIVSNILDRLSRGDFVRGDVWSSFGPEILLAVGLATLGGTIIWRVNMYFGWKLEGLVVRNIATEIFNHLMRMSASFHANTFGGSLVSQTNKFLGGYVRITDTTVFNTGGLFWSLVFSNALLLTRAPFFVLLLDVISVVFVVSAFFVTREVRRRNAVESEASNRQTGQLADSITNVMAVKGFAGEVREDKRFYDISEKWRHSLMSLMRATMKSMTVFSITSSTLYGVAIVAAVASVVVYDADIATVFLVFAFTAEIRQRLWDFGNSALRNYNRAFGDAQAMKEILNTPLQIKDPQNPEASRMKEGAISFQDMTFAHAESGDDVLFQKLSLNVKAGEKIGLVGHSGSGKTTLTKLLLRFNDLDDGQILIDGQNIAHVTQTDLRAAIAYVPQEPLLFHRSIKENIAYGKPDATDEEIKKAARHANATEFVEKLPKGYETLVGERGVKLSGGQRQRVAIARAMLKDAPILVLDEATSALDSESEKLIQKALWALMEGRTAIVIAHRLSTIQKMDRIVVLEDGAMVEQGSHKELIGKKGTYAKLWTHQSGGFLEE